MATQTIKPPQKLHAAQLAFGDLSPALARELETVSLTNHYPAGAVLFSEGQAPRGIYFVQRGLVKMSVCASAGRTILLCLARHAVARNASSPIGTPRFVPTPKAQQPCDITFIRQSDVLRMMRVHGEFALWITQLLSRDYNFTCREIRTLMLSGSATEKLARLLVGWLDERHVAHDSDRMKVPLTHEEIGQMIGTSRETVTRLMAGFRKQRLIEQEGATLVVSNRVALESLITA
jgi:CRP/FNR family transcriptional regulator